MPFPEGRWWKGSGDGMGSVVSSIDGDGVGVSRLNGSGLGVVVGLRVRSWYRNVGGVSIC